MSTIADKDIDRLAWQLERGGITGHEADIERLVERAGPEGASPVLVGVLEHVADRPRDHHAAEGLVAG